jgi:hypothetical protein
MLDLLIMVTTKRPDLLKNCVVGGNPEIIGPLTLLGFPVVEPYFLRSIAAKTRWIHAA